MEPESLKRARYSAVTTASSPLRDVAEYSLKKRIGGAVMILLCFIAIGAVGFCWIEPGYTWLDGLYMTVITISTVGYEVVGGHLTQAGKIWSIFVIAGGLVLLTIVGTQIAALVVEGQLQGFIGRRQLNRKIAALRGHVIVCGYGRMGGRVARELSASGRDVVVIDNTAERTAAAEQAGMMFVMGDAQEEDVLAAAGLEHASILVAVLSDDPENLFVTLSARQENPDLLIISRAQEAASQSKLKRAGADRVVCPQIIGANRMSDVVLRPAMVDFVEMAHSGVDLEMDQLLLGGNSSLVGKTLAELELPRRAGAHVVAVRHADGKTNYRPDHRLKLAEGDNLILVGRVGAAEAVEQMQEED